MLSLMYSESLQGIILPKGRGGLGFLQVHNTGNGIRLMEYVESIYLPIGRGPAPHSTDGFYISLLLLASAPHNLHRFEVSPSRILARCGTIKKNLRHRTETPLS